MQLIDKVAWLCVVDRKLLLVRTRGRRLSYVPGGKRELGETDQAALIREIKEEVNVELNVSSLRFAGCYCDWADGYDAAKVQLTAYFADYAGVLATAAEIEEMCWVTSTTSRPVSAVARRVLLQLKHDGVID